MRLSTRSRYGLRAMINLARNWDQPVSSAVIAESESVSKKYLDGLFNKLRKADLLKSYKGQGGGYTLARPPWEITARDVVQVLEGGLEIVSCADDAVECPKTGKCPTRELWRSVSAGISDMLGKITLAQLAAWEPGSEPDITDYYI